MNRIRLLPISSLVTLQGQVRVLDKSSIPISENSNTGVHTATIAGSVPLRPSCSKMLLNPINKSHNPTA